MASTAGTPKGSAPPDGLTGPATAPLEVDGVSKSYGRVRALDDVSLTLPAGAFAVLLGVNGAGKTTLLQLLTGLFTADKGTIRVLGRDLSAEPEAALGDIGVVFQQQTLDPELTVAGNLRFHADLFGLDRDTAATRIADALDRVRLTDVAKTRVSALSGGNRRRVELARALLHRPRVLLMDEATVGLDPATRRDLLGHVRQLARDDKVAVLWATHLTDEAEQADRLIVLDHGRILFSGDKAALLATAGTETIEAAFLALTGSSDGAASG